MFLKIPCFRSCSQLRWLGQAYSLFLSGRGGSLRMFPGTVHRAYLSSRIGMARTLYAGQECTGAPLAVWRRHRLCSLTPESCSRLKARTGTGLPPKRAAEPVVLLRSITNSAQSSGAKTLPESTAIERANPAIPCPWRRPRIMTRSKQVGRDLN